MSIPDVEQRKQRDLTGGGVKLGVVTHVNNLNTQEA